MDSNENVTKKELEGILNSSINSKSTLITYVLWFFLGYLGVHRLYVGKIGTGVTILILTVVGWFTMLIGVGVFFLGIVGLWWLIDAFMIFLWSKNSAGTSPRS